MAMGQSKEGLCGKSFRVCGNRFRGKSGNVAFGDSG